MKDAEEKFQLLDQHVKQQLPKFKKLAKRSKAHLVQNLKRNAEMCRQKILKTNHKDNDVNTVKNRESGEFLEKKLKRITEEIEVVNGISEESIAKYVLTFGMDCKALMAVAANIKNSKILRCTARIACHQPLLNYFKRMKSKEQSQDLPQSKPLDNISLSYEIVKMRGCIKSAKVCIMHKLTRNLTNLRKRTNCVKVKQKEEKIVKKICCLKELDTDDVTKFLFTNTICLDSLLSNDKTPLKVQLMSMIGKHKAVAIQLDKFKNKYPNWNKSVQTILEKPKKKKKRLSKPHKSKEEEVFNGKLDNMIEINKSNDISEQASDEEGSTNEIEEEITNSSGLSDTEDEIREEKLSSNYSYVKSENSTKKPLLEKNLKIKEMVVKETEDKGTKSESDGSAKDKICTKKKKVNDNQKGFQHQNDILGNDTSGENCSKKIKKKEPKNSNYGTSNYMHKQSKGADASLEISQSLSDTIRESLTSKPKVVDSFFITKDNKEYLSSQPPTQSDGNQNNLTDIELEFGKPGRNYGRKEKPHLLGSKRKLSGKEENWSKPRAKLSKFENLIPNSTMSKPFPKDGLIIGNRKERRKAMQETNNCEKVEKLHPSWEAKKKQSHIAQFQGKKIVFE